MEIYFEIIKEFKKSNPFIDLRKNLLVKLKYIKYFYDDCIVKYENAFEYLLWAIDNLNG